MNLIFDKGLFLSNKTYIKKIKQSVFKIRGLLEWFRKMEFSLFQEVLDTK